MKKILYILIPIALLFGIAQFKNSGPIEIERADAWGLFGAIITPSGGASPPSLLADITFTGADDSFGGTWTSVVAGTSWDDDSTTCNDSDDECLASDGSLQRWNQATFSGSPRWATIWFSIDDENNHTANINPLEFQNAATFAGGVQLAWSSDHWIPVIILSSASGGNNCGTCLVQGDGTMYGIKVKYVKAPGTNDGTLTFWFTMDGTTWTNETSNTNNPYASDVDGFRTGGYNNPGTIIRINRIKFSGTDIADCR